VPEGDAHRAEHPLFGVGQHPDQDFDGLLQALRQVPAELRQDVGGDHPIVCAGAPGERSGGVEFLAPAAPEKHRERIGLVLEVVVVGPK